jgi:uncharacterized protein (DUF952 family)
MKKDHHLIFHFCSSEQWMQQENENVYVDSSLETEGFIHCSTTAQVSKVLARYFKGRKDIYRLHIDTALLDPPLLYEKADSDGDSYPHIFGPINKTAIIEVQQIL